MSNSDFQILAQLYVFLSQFDASDIAAAGSRAVSENIRNALGSLAREAREGVNGSVPTTTVPHRSRRRLIPAKDTKSSSTKLLKKDIKNFLLDEKRFADKSSLVQFALKVGAPEAASPKYSRERVAHHIAQRAAKDEKFGKELQKLIGSLERVDPQSRGWMDLILGR